MYRKICNALVVFACICVFSCSKPMLNQKDTHSFILGKIVKERENLLYYHVGGKPYDLLIIAVLKNDNTIHWYRYENRHEKKNGILDEYFYTNFLSTEERNNYFKNNVETIFNGKTLDELDGVEIGAKASTSNKIDIYYKFVNQRRFFSQHQNDRLMQTFKKVLQLNKIDFD